MWLFAALLVVSACSLPQEQGRKTQNLYEGSPIDMPATDFQLTGQDGEGLSLAGFRGRTVLLAFMDSRCDEVCPLTAAEFLRTHELLGARSPSVVFLAVNTNPDFARAEDVRAFGLRFGLDRIPSWLFLTGPESDLRPVWRAYNIDVRPQPGQHDFSHTPGVYVIDPQGIIRWYVSVPLSVHEGDEPWVGPALSDILAKRARALA